MRDVLIAGIGSTAFGKHSGTAIQSLAVRASDAAIRESGFDRSPGSG